MLFCPNCANLLVISAETGYNKWACNTCAYEFPITKQGGLLVGRVCTYILTCFVDDIPDEVEAQASGRRAWRGRTVETC